MSGGRPPGLPCGSGQTGRSAPTGVCYFFLRFLPGASFVVNGAAMASDSALLTGSAEMKWINGWSTAATFEGEFSNVTASYAGKGVVRYAL